MTASTRTRIRNTIKQDRKTITTLKALITKVATECNMDMSQINKRIASAMNRSEYGDVNGLINLLSAICAWPADQGDGASVADNQARIDSLGLVDTVTLNAIRGFRGFHTFANDHMEIIDGSAPNYEMYEGYCTVFLEELKCKTPSASIDPVKWERREASAIERTKAGIEAKLTLLAEHKALVDTE